MSDISVHKDTEGNRYAGTLEGTEVGFATYRDKGDAVELPHTVIPPEFGGRGYAGEIVRFALDDIRAQGRRVIPTCPYVRSWLDKHPEYADLQK